MRKLAENETKLGWMESKTLDVGEYHCFACDKFFEYANYDNDHLPPEFCPRCGRKNVLA